MENLLREYDRNGISEELAYEIYTKSMQPENVFKLFDKARKVRDGVCGNKIELFSGTGVILDCELEPPCSYCAIWNNKSHRFKKILKGIPKLKEAGVNKIMLVGGSSIDGQDEKALDLVKQINEVSDIKIEINFGGLIREETLKKLKNMNVTGITSSLEVYNREIFEEAKPGDSYDLRVNLLKLAEENGFDIRSFIMIGLGEDIQDRIDHLFFLKSFTKMKSLVLSRFTPERGTPFADRKPGAVGDILRTVSIARLIMPDINILTSRTSHSELPLLYLAGSGNQIFSAMVQENEIAASEKYAEKTYIDDEVVLVNWMPHIEYELSRIGYNIEY